MIYCIVALNENNKNQNMKCNFVFHSFNFEMCLEMAKEIVVDADDMCENNMRKMADQIKQLDKIR